MKCYGCESEILKDFQVNGVDGYRCWNCYHWMPKETVKQGGSMNKVEVEYEKKYTGIHDIPVGKFAIVTGGTIGRATNIGDLIYRSNEDERSIVNLTQCGCSYQAGCGKEIAVEVLPENTEIKIVVGV